MMWPPPVSFYLVVLISYILCAYVSFVFIPLQEFGQRIRPMVCDTVVLVNKAIADGKKVILEGANAAMLDIDFGKLMGVNV